MKTETLTAETFLALILAATRGEAIEIPACATAEQSEKLTAAYAKGAARAAERAAFEAADAKILAAHAEKNAAKTAAKAARSAVVPAGSVKCPCCSRAVKVVAGRIVRHGHTGGVNGYTGPMATGMRMNRAITNACDGSGQMA